MIKEVQELGLASVRPEVLRVAIFMEAVLRQNDHKGGWKDNSSDALYARVCEEMVEVEEAFQANAGRLKATGYHPTLDYMNPADRDDFVQELIDVMNMSMMVIDVLGYLDEASLNLGGSIEFTPDVVKQRLDDMIAHWRGELDEALESAPTPDHEIMARCYIDAFQSFRTTLFGEVLPGGEKYE